MLQFAVIFFDPNSIFSQSINHKATFFSSYGLNKELTSYGHCAGGGDGRYGVGSDTFVNSRVPSARFHDHEKLPAVWVGNQVDPVVHLQRFPIWKIKISN